MPVSRGPAGVSSMRLGQTAECPGREVCPHKTTTQGNSAVCTLWRSSLGHFRFEPGCGGPTWGADAADPVEMVDEALAETRSAQRRIRDLLARVVVYLLLAGCPFKDLGCRQVWDRLVAGLDGLGGAGPDGRWADPGPSSCRRQTAAVPVRSPPGPGRGTVHSVRRGVLDLLPRCTVSAASAQALTLPAELTTPAWYQCEASAARAAALSAFVFAWPVMPQPPSGNSVINAHVRSA
jgi:hypothetical protein